MRSFSAAVSTVQETSRYRSKSWPCLTSRVCNGGSAFAQLGDRGRRGERGREEEGARAAHTMPEFKYVKYADQPQPADPVRAKLDQDVDKLVPAPQLNAVLCCGRTVHAFSLRNHRVEKSAKELSTTVLSCIHLPSLSSIFVSTTTCKVASYDDTWFKLQREFLTEDPQLCFLAPKPHDHRRGTPTPVPSRLLTADTSGNLYEWDLTGRLSGLVQPLNERVVAKDWVTALLVPDGNLTTLVTASLDTSVKLWDRRTVWDEGAAPIRTIDAHSRPVTGLLDLPRLDMCLSFGNDGVNVWSPGPAASVMQKLSGHERPIVNVFQGATWEELISVDRGGNVIVWDARFFNKLQQLEDATLIEDDIVTDACYDPSREAILTTRRHIRMVTMNVRGRVSASKAGVSTDAGPVSLVGLCAHTLHFLTVAGNEVTYWRCSDGRAEAVITGLAGTFSQTYGRILTVILHMNDVPCSWNQGKCSPLSNTTSQDRWPKTRSLRW